MVLFVMSCSSLILLLCFIYYVRGEPNYTAARLVNAYTTGVPNQCSGVRNNRLPHAEEPNEDVLWYWADQCYQKDCIDTFKSSVKPGMFCAGVIARLQGHTAADRGNGLICPGEQLVGVATSASGPIGRKMFTGVVFHSKWIEKTQKRRCALEWWMIVSIIAAVLLVLLAILIFSLLKRDKDEEDGEEGEEGEGEEEEEEG